MHTACERPNPPRAEATPGASAAPQGLAGQLVLRAPVGAELRACRMLLPETLASVMSWEPPRIALVEQPYRVLGALATARLLHADGRPRLRLALHVAPPYRGQGVGSALLERITGEARAAGVGALLVWMDAPESPAGPWLTRRGFRLWDSETTFEAPLASLIARLRRLHDWLAARGSIPGDTRFVPLSQAPLEAAAALYAEHIGGSPRSARARLTQLASGPQAEAQSVLMVGERLAGLQLGGLAADHCHVDAKVVAPEFRARTTGLAWADVALMMHRAEWAQARGHAHCRFSCLSGNVHTNKLARHAGAREVKRLEVLRLGL